MQRNDSRGVAASQGEQVSRMRADLHVHSNYSYDVPNLPEFSPRALYDRAVESGMGLFALTDHDTLDGFLALRRELRDAYGDRPPIPLLSGVEIKVCDPAVGHTIHVNVLGLAPEQFVELTRRTRSVDAILAYCREHGLFHVYDHPFWFERGERPAPGAVEALIARFPVIELNGGRIRELNARTEQLARRHGKPLLAASDTHTGRVGKSFTRAPGDGADSYLASILAGRGEPCPDHMTSATLLAEISHTVDLVLQGIARYSRLPLPSGADWRTRLWGRILGPRWLYRRRLPRRGVGRLLKFLARTPVHAFIRGQRRMLLRLEEDGG
jgi:predicted metal-dependent phosphoesterase TrpH